MYGKIKRTRVDLGRKPSPVPRNKAKVAARRELNDAITEAANRLGQIRNDHRKGKRQDPDYQPKHAKPRKGEKK